MKKVAKQSMTKKNDLFMIIFAILGIALIVAFYFYLKKFPS